ncbi:hypothetical protein FEM48_Zijuj11G0054700 [Ziziphus jujuba var. spinosa]|uniref:PHD finger protein ALFIN-LIKE n=1 Tax=Ziziphus jujuba var. spinosa TaxID=714518 RepID=A0A978UH34_ZIZJJ|nr:hypothetical protein FEM48_Zijuj11G0054700 [Ziziphus jujuba var. spinosa]
MNSSVGIAFAPHVIIVRVGEKENLCLYGLPNKTWEVILLVEEVPPKLPESTLGINHARDGMQKKDWLSLVAVHSDLWLLAIAFYLGLRFGFYCGNKAGTGIDQVSDLYKPYEKKCSSQPPPRFSVTYAKPREPKIPVSNIGPILGKPYVDLSSIYTLDKELGSGQFGITLLCTEKATSRKYACKSSARRKLVTNKDVEDVRMEIQIKGSKMVGVWKSLVFWGELK